MDTKQISPEMSEARPLVILLVGLPGCGKSSYARAQRWTAISSDALRALLLDDEAGQTANDRVFALVREILRHRLELRRPVTCIDATNIKPEERAPYIEIAREHGANVAAVFFDIPFETCQHRNQNRPRVVPLEAMQLLASRITPPVLEEGLAAIRVVR